MERERALAVAIDAMNSVAGRSDNTEEHSQLRAAAQEAHIDLELVEAEMQQHRDMRHATVH